MQIELKKKSLYECEYTITRKDGSVELITLDTKTYFLHDICHYVVEKNLKYTKGFWGMLAEGYTFQSLFGKDNQQTSELRFIEQIVGPIQSVYWGHIPKIQLSEYINHLHFSVSDEILNICLEEVDIIMKDWEYLEVGKKLVLEWPFFDSQPSSS